MLSGLLHARVDDRLAGAVHDVRDLMAAVECDAGDEARERARDVLEGVVIVVADDHSPGAPERATWPSYAGYLNGLAHPPKDNARGATVQLIA
jgi:hypothetical protein